MILSPARRRALEVRAGAGMTRIGRHIGPSSAEKSRMKRAVDRDLPTWRRKQDYPCCAATRDEYGRLCIGWCSAGCLRRRAARRAS